MKSDIQYDVIIIGGGLAGLALAIQLASSNRSVLVIEKNKYPFHRVCGEYVSMESWPFLIQLGLPLHELNLPIITQVQVSSLSGKILSHPLDIGGFGISRFLLDYTLASVAKSSGVALLEQHRVEEVTRNGDSFFVKTQQDVLQGNAVIGAFGKRSNMDKRLNRQVKHYKPSENWVGVKYHIKADLPTNVIQLHNFTNGYCGVSKIEDDRYCLCYLTRADNLREYGGNIMKMEEDLLAQNRFLKNYFSDRKNFLLKTPETISQITFENKRPVENGILMVGDAAGMITPLCGNGMSMAFHASLICFRVLERFLSGQITRDQMEWEYSNNWKRAFAARLRVGRALQPLLVKSFLSNPVIAALKYLPFAMDKIVKSTHGKPF